MIFTPPGTLHKWLVGAALFAVGTFLLALALTPTLAQTSNSSLLATYDANENGQIDEVEFVQAAADYHAGKITRADVAAVGQLYISTLPALGVSGQGDLCSAYDFNGDGGVDSSETYAAYIDFELNLLTARELADVYACPPPPPTPTPTPTPTPVTPTPTPTPVTPTPTPTPKPPPNGGGPGLSKLPAPTNLHFFAWNTSSVNLRWTGDTRAASYRVLKRVGATGTFKPYGTDSSEESRPVIIRNSEHPCPTGTTRTPFAFQVQAIGDGRTYSAMPSPPSNTLHVSLPCNPVVNVRADPASIGEGQQARFVFSAEPAPLLDGDVITVGISHTAQGGFLGDTVPASVKIKGTGGSFTLALDTQDNGTCDSDGDISIRITSVSFSSGNSISGQQTIVGTASTPAYGFGPERDATVDITDEACRRIPVVTIEKKNPMEQHITEGEAGLYTLRASRAPSAPLTVKLRVDQSVGFRSLANPFITATISKGETSAEVAVATKEDTLDEVHGTQRVTVQLGTGYAIGAPFTAGLAIHDDDLPPTPQSLRVNGKLDNGHITLRWGAVPRAISYNVRYIVEICGEPGTCYLSGERTVLTGVQTTGSTPVEARIRGSSDVPLQKNTLYRIEVQAVIVDGSKWSDFAGVYPTDAPLSYPWVAGVGVGSYQTDGELDFAICQPLPTDITEAAIANALEQWETTVRWHGSSGNIITATAALATTCDEYRAETRNQIRFVDKDTIDDHCPPVNNMFATLACWRTPEELTLATAQDPQTMLLINDPQQNWLVKNLGECTELHYTVIHESGHALGLLHSHYIHSMMLRRYLPESMYCAPTPHDVTAVMANYQSR